MAYKPRQTATCPRFIARVDYQGQSAIQCTSWSLLYHDRQERDADYAAACCDRPELCPLQRVPAGTVKVSARRNGKTIPTLWPAATNHSTIDETTQEAQNHERN